MRTSFVHLLLVIVSLFCCSKENTTGPKALTPEDLLPKNNDISGWQRTGNHWTASSNTELNNYINGEAVIYTSRGFVEAAMQEYEGTVLGNTVTVVLRIFDQGTVANAESVFDELVRQMSSPIDWPSGAGEKAKIERFSLSQRIIFWQSKYFVSLSISSGENEALNVLKMFANNVDSKI